MALSFVLCISLISADVPLVSRRRRESRWDLLEEAPIMGSTADELLPESTSATFSRTSGASGTASRRRPSAAASSSSLRGDDSAASSTSTTTSTAMRGGIRSRFLRRAMQNHLASQIENQRGGNRLPSQDSSVVRSFENKW